MQIEGQTNMTKVIVAFCNFAKGPRKEKYINKNGQCDVEWCLWKSEVIFDFRHFEEWRRHTEKDGEGILGKMEKAYRERCRRCVDVKGNNVKKIRFQGMA
jgi:hypothetical protein